MLSAKCSGLSFFPLPSPQHSVLSPQCSHSPLSSPQPPAPSPQSSALSPDFHFLIAAYACTDNGFQNLFFRFGCMIKIPSLLKVHPEIGRVSPFLSIDNLVDTLKGNMDGIGKLALRDSHGYEEFLEQHFSRMHRDSVWRYAYHHIATLLFENIRINFIIEFWHR